MFLHTLGSAILVAGLSYLLVKASWQIVLLSFMASGVGVAIWRVRNAFVRRSKIKGLWKRSMEIDSMLEDLDELTKLPVTRQPAYATASANFAEPPKNQSIRDLTRINRVAQPVAARSQQAPQVVPLHASRTEARKFSMSKLASSRAHESRRASEAREAPAPYTPPVVVPAQYIPPIMAPAVHELGIQALQQSDQFASALDDLYPPVAYLQEKQAAEQSYGVPLYATKPAPWQIEAQSITH